VIANGPAISIALTIALSAVSLAITWSLAHLLGADYPALRSIRKSLTISFGTLLVVSVLVAGYEQYLARHRQNIDSTQLQQILNEIRAHEKCLRASVFAARIGCLLGFLFLVVTSIWIDASKKCTRWVSRGWDGIKILNTCLAIVLSIGFCTGQYQDFSTSRLRKLEDQTRTIRQAYALFTKEAGLYVQEQLAQKLAESADDLIVTETSLDQTLQHDVTRCDGFVDPNSRAATQQPWTCARHEHGWRQDPEDFRTFAIAPIYERTILNDGKLESRIGNTSPTASITNIPADSAPPTTRLDRLKQAIGTLVAKRQALPAREFMKGLLSMTFGDLLKKEGNDILARGLGASDGYQFELAGEAAASIGVDTLMSLATELVQEGLAGRIAAALSNVDQKLTELSQLAIQKVSKRKFREQLQDQMSQMRGWIEEIHARAQMRLEFGRRELTSKLQLASYAIFDNPAACTELERAWQAALEPTPSHVERLREDLAKLSMGELNSYSCLWERAYGLGIHFPMPRKISPAFETWHPYTTSELVQRITISPMRWSFVEDESPQYLGKPTTTDPIRLLGR
jgi:hypothetical protein